MAATPPPATAVDIEALADSLSACADELHTRLMRAIRKPSNGAPAAAASAASAPAAPGPAAAVPDSLVPGMSEGAAQALFENEVALRQRANSLYLDAAVLAAGGLAGAQHQLLELTAQAQEKIRKIDRIKDLIDITGELLAVGAAVASGKPEHIAAPLEKIKKHIDALRANNGTPAAPT